MSESASVPAIRFDGNVVREYADAGVATDSIEEVPAAGPSSTGPHEHPPAYTEATSMDPKEILAKAHPRTQGSDAAADDEYRSIVSATGLRCTVIEDELKARKAERQKGLFGGYFVETFQVGQVADGLMKADGEVSRARERLAITSCTVHGRPSSHLWDCYPSALSQDSQVSHRASRTLTHSS